MPEPIENSINVTINREELILLWEFLEYQFVSYEKPELINLVRKLGRAYNELAEDTSRPA